MNIRLFITREGRAQAKLERLYRAKVRKALLKQALEFAETGVFMDYLTEEIEELYLTVTKRYWRAQRFVLEKMEEKSIFTEGFDLWFNAFVRNHLVEKVVAINDNTRDSLKALMDELIPLSLPFEDMAYHIQRSFACSTRRAMTITRTEVGNAMNMAKKKSVEEEENLYKIWIHRGAKDPRDWHQKLDNGRAIPADQPFIVDDGESTERMDTPHDLGASAKNVINCGCEVLYMTESFARKNKYL